MRGKNTIYINGRQYDAVTGLQVSVEPTKPVANATSIDGVRKPAHTAAKHIKRAPAPHHTARRTSKSATLRRDLVKKPQVKAPAITARPNRVHTTVAKSPAISRFASHPMAMKPAPSLSKVTLAPSSSSVNHTVSRIHKAASASPAPKTAPKALSSRELKEKLITEKLAQIDHKAKPEKVAKKRFAAYPRLTSIMTASFALVVLGGYLTYINMPNLSMRVAASQAGVNAKFPDYHPAGYSFNGPIAYSGGEVAVKFEGNGGSDQSYTIRQKNSSWDSQAVLDNYVAKESAQYMTSSEQGLTIYTYKNKAAWVNGGVLYTIEGNAPLSNEQVLRIAGSM
jgi:hypothetical protein